MPHGPLLLTAGRASRLLKAMGNERRFVILCHLTEREHSVTELSSLVGLSQSALSQHLAKLRRDNLVKTRRSAQTVFYSVASPEVRPILHFLSAIFTHGATTMPNGRPGLGPDKPGSAGTAHSRAAWDKSST